MKTTLFVFALLGSASSLAQAQNAIPAGTVSLGGSIGYNRTTESQDLPGGTQADVSNSRFRIAPSVGYFMADNLALGLDLRFTATNTTISNHSENDLDASTTLRVGPYVQYYKMLSEQFGVLGTLGAGYQRSFTPTYSSPNTTTDVTTSGYYASLTPGIIFFPIPKFGISASMGYLGYDHASYKPSSTSRTVSNLGAAFGLDQLLFGGTFYFGR